MPNFNAHVVCLLCLLTGLEPLHARSFKNFFSLGQRRNLETIAIKKKSDPSTCLEQKNGVFGVRGGSSFPDFSDDEGYPYPPERGHQGPGPNAPPMNNYYESQNDYEGGGHGNGGNQGYEQAHRSPPPQHDPRYRQRQGYNQHGSNNYGEPDLPPPSLPGAGEEPAFPDSGYEPSYPEQGGHPPPQQQRQQQQRYRQPGNAPRSPPQSMHQQTAQQPTMNDRGRQDLQELESFDKDLIFQGLKRMYRKKILPLEISSKYGHFHSPPLSPSDFDAKPMVLLLGQYSVGKTSFIRYLLGRDFPGQRVGPEPTTDRFTCILDGDVDKVIPGAALCSQADRPFRGLSPFGNNFLSKLEAVELDAPILRNITLVDTPGILSGAKQSVGRNYDYDAVMKWFAERADLIIIMFDTSKLDISDELKRVIEMMKPHADKVRVVLNKADSVSTQQLMRVYGALMWQLGKVMNTPEVCRVYMGSFWGAPLKNTEQAPLLNREKLDLFNDIAQLPQNAVMRRINELVKRARGVKVHAYIIHYLRKQLPYTFGKREKQARLIGRLDRELVMCARRYELPRGDFPPLEPLRQALLEIKDLSEFPKLDKKMVKEMDKVFSVDIPQLLERARGEL